MPFLSTITVDVTVGAVEMYSRSHAADPPPCQTPRWIELVKSTCADAREAAPNLLTYFLANSGVHLYDDVIAHIDRALGFDRPAVSR